MENDELEQVASRETPGCAKNQRLVSRTLAERPSRRVVRYADEGAAAEGGVLADRRRMARADLKGDTELLALIEARVEKEKPHLKPDFDGEALARLLDVTPSRLSRLFRNNTPHHTPEDYIDFRRVISAMEQCAASPTTAWPQWLRT